MDGGPGRGFGLIVSSSVENVVQGNECYANGGTGGTAGSSADRSGYSEGTGILVQTESADSVSRGNQVTDNTCYENNAPGADAASTDVGDVSWIAPMAEFKAATWVPGTTPHTWQAAAAGGMSIGVQGMMVAAKAMALTGIDLFSDPTYVQEAREELERKRGGKFTYRARIGDRRPPLDYRK